MLASEWIIESKPRIESSEGWQTEVNYRFRFRNSLRATKPVVEVNDLHARGSADADRAMI